MQMSSDKTVRFAQRCACSLSTTFAGLLLLSACGSGAPDDVLGEDPASYDEAWGDPDIAGQSAALELAEADEGAEEGSPTRLVEALVAPADDESSCLMNITDYGERGPFRYSSRRVGMVNMLVPSVPAGCRVPVAHLSNGTGARCSMYQSILNSLASHGFLTTCYESANTGSGAEGLEALERAVATYPTLAARRFASLGHSQGGQAAFVVLALAEERFGADATYAGLAMQPASGFGDQPRGATWQQVYARIDSPMFMFSGTWDILVSASWVRRGFEALNNDVEAYNWSARGATHIPTPNRETIEVAIPWFRWKLLNDYRACERFKALPNTYRWSERQVQNEEQCD